MVWMELECIMLSKLRQSEKDKPYDFTHMWNLRNKRDEHMDGGEGGKRERKRERGEKTIREQTEG